MKKLCLLCFVSVSIILGACKKESTGCPYTLSTMVAPPAEIDSVQRFITANGINAEAHPSGVFYRVNTEGTQGANPTACSLLTAEYSGTLFSGAPFGGTNAGEPVQFALGELIAGWHSVLPLLKGGSDVDLFIPPSLAYGSAVRENPNGTIAIPANSYLIFHIKLYSVQ
jgi:FKBP-type peptidyl-prolyl cis-trans isomerase FkpA